MQIQDVRAYIYIRVLACVQINESILPTKNFEKVFKIMARKKIQTFLFAS